MSEDRSATFAALVHRILVVERRRPVREVAEALGMKYATFYARMIGRVPFDADEINAVLREVRDERLVDCLLAETGFIGVRRGDDPGPPSRGHNVGPVENALHALEQSVGIVREVSCACADGGLKADVCERIEDHLVEAERGLAGLRVNLREPAR